MGVKNITRSQASQWLKDNGWIPYRYLVHDFGHGSFSQSASLAVTSKEAWRKGEEPPRHTHREDGISDTAFTLGEAIAIELLNQKLQCEDDGK